MTSINSDTPPPVCYTDYALQEYALERLSNALRSDIADHLNSCTACKTTLESIEREVCYFQQLETPRQDVPDENCMDDTEMARFLDAGENDEGYETRLEHLQQCPSCRNALIQMREEIARALAQAAGALDEERSESSQILTMPERPASDDQDEDDLPDFNVTRSGTGA